MQVHTLSAWHIDIDIIITPNGIRVTDILHVDNDLKFQVKRNQGGADAYVICFN